MRVLKNAIYLSLMQASNVLLGLLVMPYVTGVLGSERLGISSFGLAAAMYCAMLGQLGMHIYGIRRVAQARDDSAALQQAFSECYAYQMFFSGFALVLYNVWALAQRDGNAGYYLLFNLTVLGYALDISWLYGGLERYDAVAIRTFLMRLVGTLLLFAFVRNGADLGSYIAVQQGSLLASNLFFWLRLRRYGILLRVAPLWVSVKRVARQSFWLFLPSLFAAIATSTDRLMLGYLSTKREVALYDYPMRLLKVGASMVGVAGNVMLPRLSHLWKVSGVSAYREALYELSHFGLLLGMLLAGGMAVTSSEICGFLLGESFRGADAVLRIAVLPLVVSGMGGYFAALAVGRERQVVAGMAVACALSVAGYACLIPLYGARGAAIAYAVPEFGVQCYYIWLVRREVLWGKFARHAVSSALLFVVAVVASWRVEVGGMLLSFLLKGGVVVCVLGGGAVALQPRTREFVVVGIRKGLSGLKR